jgi:hypothetical protein
MMEGEQEQRWKKLLLPAIIKQIEVKYQGVAGSSELKFIEFPHN